MTARLGRARCIALLPGLVASLLTAEIAAAACVAIASHPDGAPLATYGLAAREPVFTVTYVHSVTLTPVEERYRIDGSTTVETVIRFEQHGPGLPTEADAGEQWTRRGDRFEEAREQAVDRDHKMDAPRGHTRSTCLRVHPSEETGPAGFRAISVGGLHRPAPLKSRCLRRPAMSPFVSIARAFASRAVSRS